MLFFLLQIRTLETFGKQEEEKERKKKSEREVTNLPELTFMDCPNFFTILCCCKEKKTFAFYCFNFSSLTLSPNPHLSPHYSRSFKNIRMRAVHKWRHRLREKVGRTMIPNLGVRGAAKNGFDNHWAMIFSRGCPIPVVLNLFKSATHKTEKNTIRRPM